MQYWRFRYYHPEGEESQIQEWYYGQDHEVMAEFDMALLMLSGIEDWSEDTDCAPLLGQFVGLYEIIVDVQLLDEETRLPTETIRVRPIGVWESDSRDFIILLCSEKNGDDYDPPLAKALEYKAALKQKKGKVDDYLY